MFSRDFRKRGTEHLTTYFRIYKRGDLVNIKGNGCFHKGMPHKYYHGKTAKVFNVTQHALGLIVNKRVRHRIIAKRIHVRVEHVSPSKCREEFLKRVRDISATKKALKEAKDKKQPVKFVQFKRIPKQPRKGHVVRVQENQIVNVAPIPYEFDA